MRQSGRLLLFSCAALLAAASAGVPGCAQGGDDPPPSDDVDARVRVDASDDDEADAGDDDEVDAGDDDDRPDGRPVDARPGSPDAEVADARPASPDARPDARIDAGQPTGGLGPWTGNDNVPPSQSPPFGIPVADAPQFVILGWDDNGYSGLEGTGGTGGMSWAVDMVRPKRNADGTPVKFSFYYTTAYIATWGAESPTYVKRSWRAAKQDGHEVGNHSQTHQTSATTTSAGWATEMDSANTWLTKPFNPDEIGHTPDNNAGIGATLDEIYGWRTPYLAYNDAMLANANSRGFRYDTSIEEGFEYDQDGTNFFWPYTLDNGSPGHAVQVEWGSQQPINNHPGLWEIPVYTVIVPPDSRCAEYGVPTGFRARMKLVQSWFDIESGKITGFDYNLWYSFRMTKAEFLATVKYSLDQRLRGNRAPFMLGVHTDYYSSKWSGGASIPASLTERQAAISELIDYATSKPMVRVTTAKNTLDWIRNPTPL
jgi:hypothetical protein